MGSLENLSAWLPSQGLFLLEQAKSNVSNKYLNTGLARGAQPALGSFFALILANGSTSGHGLLIGLTLSLLLCAFGLRFATNQGNRITDLPNPSLSDLRSVAGKYSNFARFTMPHETFAAVSSRVAVVLIPMYFGSAIAGFFFMAQKFATIPSLLISSSASQVYFHETAAKINRLETPRPVFIAALTTAALASISIYIVAVLALPRLIPLLLGPGWERSIAFTHLLLPWAAINFIGSILSQTPQALGKQQTAMLCEIANGTLRIAGLTLGFFLNNPSFGLILFLASGALFSIGRILWYSRLTKEFKPTVAAP